MMWRNLRRFSTKKSYSEVQIPVPWGHVSGKWWGPTNKRPLLAIHGWQDNCGTFNRLIPLLKPDISILAIDLPGHGYSSRLPPGMYYHNMNYPILMKQIANHFNWPKISLMGHSLGAISCFIHTMLFPDNVDFLVCIDGLKPLYKKNNAPRMAAGIMELLKYDALAQDPQEPPSYTLEVLIKKLAALNNESISAEHCHHILERNVKQSKIDSGKYYVTRDPRLKSRLIMNWSQADLVEGAYRVTTPILILKSTKSGYFEEKKNFDEVLEPLKRSSRDLQLHSVEGTHHALLNNPESMSPIINNFIELHDIEKRDIDGVVN